jgi:hypothetical protein
MANAWMHSPSLYLSLSLLIHTVLNSHSTLAHATRASRVILSAETELMENAPLEVNSAPALPQTVRGSVGIVGQPILSQTEPALPYTPQLFRTVRNSVEAAVRHAIEAITSMVSE